MPSEYKDLPIQNIQGELPVEPVDSSNLSKQGERDSRGGLSKKELEKLREQNVRNLRSVPFESVKGQPVVSMRGGAGNPEEWNSQGYDRGDPPTQGDEARAAREAYMERMVPGYRE